MALVSAFRRWSPLVAHLALAGLLNTTLDGPVWAETLRNRPRLVRLDRLAAIPAVPAAGEVSGPDLSPPPMPEDADSLPGNAPAPPQSLALTAEGIPLVPGWNLVSLPREPDSVDPAAVFSSISGGLVATFTYDGCNASDPWRVYVPGAPEVSDLASVDHRVGVWVRSSNAAALAVSGMEPAETVVQLCQGWNLIGYPLSHPRPVLNALASIAGRFARVMAYDPADAEDPWEAFDVGAPAWANDLQTMQPGRGYWVYATEDVSLRMANTGPPPEVSITAPADAVTITSPTEVRGTVRSDLLESWRLEYRLKGESAFTTFATGNVPVTNAVLGSFDPTLLLNGMFEVRLTARDFAGRTASASINAVVEGGLKIGNFTLPFLDLEIPGVGIPIQVVRTYDSRDKRKGDFGYGWTLSVSDFRVEESGPSGEHWEGVRIGGLLPTYCVRPKRAHVVTITLSDGTVLRFVPTVTNECQRLLPPQNVNLLYVPQPGTFARLEPLDHGARVLVIGGFPGPVELWDESRMVLHDAGRYRLTLENGSSFVITQGKGLDSVADLNGNTLRFTGTGISHSAGLGVSLQRDSQGRIQQITDPLRYSLRYEYDASGDLVSVTDQENRKTRFNYFSGHYLRSIVLPDGREVLAAEYDGDRRLIRTCQGATCLARRSDFENNREIWTDPLGRETVVHYDTAGRVTALTEVGAAESRTTSFEYNSLGQVTKQVEPDGAQTVVMYDSRGNPSSVVLPVPPGENPAEHTTTFAHDTRGNMTSVQYPSGLGYRLSYDAAGNLLELRDDEGRVLEKAAYRADGALLSEEDPFGRFVYSSFDAHANPEVVTDPGGNVLAGQYDANGRLLQMSVNDGPVSTFSYDGLGRETSARYGSGIAIDFGYEGANPAWTRFESPQTGSLERVTDPAGRLQGLALDGRLQTRYQYDAAGRLVVERGPLGRDVGYRYDDFGQLAARIAPNGGETRFVHDLAGRVVEQTDALGHNVRFTYRPDDKVRSFTDPRGNAWSFEYTINSVRRTDPLGRSTTTLFTKEGNPWKTVHPDGTERAVHYLRDVPLGEEGNYIERIVGEGGQERRYGYGAAGELESATDLAGAVYRILPDEDATTIQAPNGESVTYTSEEDSYSIRYGDGGETRFDLGIRGELSRKTLPSGGFVAAEYDAQGRRVRSTDSVIGTPSVFEWNEADELVRTLDPAGETTYSYDSLGKLAQQRNPSGEVFYERDLVGRITTSELRPADGASSSRRISYRYDAAGNLIEVSDPEVGSTMMEYDAANRLVKRTLPNGITSEHTYDLRDRIATLAHRDASGSVVASFAYERGALGEPVRVTREDGSFAVFGYDEALRLTREAYFDPSGNMLEETLYSYDAAGNRQTRTDRRGLASYSYRPGFQLESVSGPGGIESYGFDPDGNVSSLQRDGRSLTFGYGAGGQLLSAARGATGTSISYQYDGLGRRIRERDGDTERNFLLAPVEGGLDAVQMVTDSDGNLVTGYVYAGTQALMRYGAGGEAFYLTDALGSVIALADAGGAITARFEYGAFGDLRSATGDGQAAPEGAGGDFRFHAGWLEEGIGLYRLGHRVYDPQTGRFLSRDPMPPVMRQPESVHPYLFANGNPQLFKDPSGLFSIVTINIRLSVESVLTAIRTLPAHYLKEEIRGKVKQWIGKAVVQGLEVFLPIDFDVAKWVWDEASDVSGIARKAELGIMRGICLILADVKWIFFEPGIEEGSGMMDSDGYHCPVDKQQNIKKEDGHRYPDFFLSRGKPTDNRNGFLLGEIKAGIRVFYDTWIERHATDRVRRNFYRREQFEAFTLHVRRFMFPGLMVLVAFNPASRRENAQMLARLLEHLVRAKVVPFIITLKSRP